MTGQPLPRPLVDLGWGGPFEALFGEHAGAGREPGRVVASHRETSIVGLGDTAVAGHVSGRFRRDALGLSGYPAVGDWVVVEARRPERSATIHAVLERRSAIVRTAGDSTRRGTGRSADEQVLAANVDVALLVAAIDRPVNLRRLERYVAMAWSSGATPVVLLNKADASDDVTGAVAAVVASAPGVDVLPISARSGAGLAAVSEHLGAGRTAVVLGPSGVGKSTLLNALLGTDRQATHDVRAADGRGRHTTTHRELFRLPTGALVIDTPGIRSLELHDADEGISAAYADVDALAATCRFPDCSHGPEPGCAVRAALADGRIDADRWAGYQKLRREAAHAARQADRLAREAERRRWATISRSVKGHMRAKYGEAYR